MGLGLQCRAQLRDETRWGEDSALLIIEEIAEERARASGLYAFFSTALANNRLALFVHPAAEPVEFQLLESGALECFAKTSSVGPGYHNYIVELLDAIGDRVGIAWNFNEEQADDTAFLRHRDFERLQREMANFLRNLSSIVVEHARKGMSGMTLNMPLGFVPQLHSAIGTPLGEWQIDRFLEAADPDFDIEKFAGEFFPWWERGITAATWRNLGLVELWMSIPWRAPTQDGERTIFENAIRSFEIARDLEPGLILPERELDELSRLLNSNSDPAVVPAAEGIGYRRRLLQESVAGGWSLEIPGFFYRRLEEKQSGDVFWYGGREIWFTSLSFKPARPARRSDIEKGSQESSSFVEHFGIVGRADIKKNDGHYTMSCVLQGEGTSAIVTVIYTDAKDEHWAKSTFESIKHNPRLSS